VGPDIRPRLDGVQKPLDRIVEPLMEIIVGPFPGQTRGAGGQFVEDAIRDGFHEHAPVLITGPILPQQAVRLKEREKRRGRSC
jgi:hypothetical protein